MMGHKTAQTKRSQHASPSAVAKKPKLMGAMPEAAHGEGSSGDRAAKASQWRRGKEKWKDCWTKTKWKSADGKEAHDRSWAYCVPDDETGEPVINLIIYLIYIKDGEAACQYSGILLQDDTTGEGIYDAIVHYLVSNGVDLSRLVALGSDGTSTMTGRENGTAAFLKRMNTFLISIHCVAHRLALACSQSTRSVVRCYAALATVFTNDCEC